MNSETLVKVDSISKKFCRSLKQSLWYGVQDIFFEIICNENSTGQLRQNEFWAIDDISFELHRGECLGIIGPNGAGKSTILKMLSGLIKPDKGKITTKGRVGALIELGAGFNPILTGRENIYVNGAILGMSKNDIDKKLDEIIEFAEIEDFIETPVQSYSSGMKIRLGFAIAAQMNPDILIIDEVLAVGDAGFRAKCYNRISQISRKAAIIFVSHSMPHISRLATKTLVLNQGRASSLGTTGLGIITYYNLFKPKSLSERIGSGEAKIISIKLLNHNGKETNNFEFGKALKVVVVVEGNINIESLIVNLAFLTVADEIVAECNNCINSFQISVKKYQKISICILIKELTLNHGTYNVSALLHSDKWVGHYDWLQNFKTINVAGNSIGTASQQFFANWRLSSEIEPQ